MRPTEVSNWIKSKKKDSVPELDMPIYGPRLTGWWNKMQPAWRVEHADEETGQLSRDTPAEETWQSLKKGGTAGIYVVIVALSWWAGASNLERDEALWVIVDDLSWILQQITMAMSPLSNKRTRDSDENDESGGKRKKR